MARGRTLELGGGTGLNLPYYPDDLDELILAEPAAGMKRLVVVAASVAMLVGPGAGAAFAGEVKGSAEPAGQHQ